MQKLAVFQSLWGMELRQPGLQEHSDRECFAMIRDAGFAGACIDLAAEEIPQFLDKIGRAHV